MPTLTRLFPLILPILFLSACAVGPNYKRPAAIVAPAYKEPPPDAFKEAQAAGLEQWLAATRIEYANRIVTIDADIAEAWGRLDAKRNLPVVDGLLAATALVRGMTLVTRNVRDVAGAGITLLNPWNA